MNINRDIFIAALDLLLIIIITLLIGFFAVRFAAQKGVGEESYFPVTLAKVADELGAVTQNKPYYAIIINENLIEVIRIDSMEPLFRDSCFSIEALSNYIKNDEVYVIYEKSDNSFFADIVRMISQTNSILFLARGK